jgi:hypothetical protein
MATTNTNTTTAKKPSGKMPLTVAAQSSVTKFLDTCLLAYFNLNAIRSQLEDRDRAYYREQDRTAAQLKAAQANTAGDADKMQNVTVPVAFPQVETALAALQETFLSGYPIFGTVAPPAYQDAMTMMDTMVGENSIRAAWPLHLLQTMRDGLKYDLGAVEVCWEQKTTFAVTTPENNDISQGKATETLYEGNYMKHLNMYNTFLDPRVAPERNHIEGEFAGYTEVLSRINVKQRMQDLPLVTSLVLTQLAPPTNLRSIRKH